MLQSVDKAVRILDLFVDHTELGATDIAEAMDMNKSTAFRFLTTLENCGLLYRTERAKYRLGLKLFSLGQLTYGRMNFASCAHPHLQRLMETTGETALLAVTDGSTGIIYIDRVVSCANLRITIEIGRRYEAHHTAIGKAFLAYQNETFLEQYYKNADFTPLTERSIISPDVLATHLLQVRERQYALDNEESESGLFCYGAPILSAQGESIAAISISGPVTRMKTNQHQKIASLQEAARRIASGLQ